MTKKLMTSVLSVALLTAMLATSAFAAVGISGTSSDIRSAINSNISGADVRVLVDGSTVYLRGTVSEFDELAQAGAIAQSANGVSQVVNQLDLKVAN